MTPYILAPEALQDLQELWDYIALDAGALGLSDDLHILVSCGVNGQTMLDELIHRFAGQRLRLPQPSYPSPARPYIAWHRKEVFRAPARTDREAHLLGVLHRAAEGQELYTPLQRDYDRVRVDFLPQCKEAPITPSPHATERG